MSLLSVTVKKARYVGVQAPQYNSYVTLKLQNVKSTTVTVKGANPCWEQDFLFETNDVNVGLLIEVWCKGMIWDRAIGYHYIPLRSVHYANEEGLGQWVSLEAELVMRDGEVVGTKSPTGDSLLVDYRFELPFGRYDPPTGWKALLAPEPEARSPRSVGDEELGDWMPLGGRDAESTDGDALQRKLERLNNTILGDEQARRQLQYYGHSGYSEDSDYTSDLNYPVGGQHANSSASQFRSAAQLMCTPQRSLETSRENSYERDDAPAQHQNQGQVGQGRSQYGGGRYDRQSYGDGESEGLYYNSRPRDYKQDRISRRRKNWEMEESQDWYSDQYGGSEYQKAAKKSSKGIRRPSLERQTTLYDEQYTSDQSYYSGTQQQNYLPYSDYQDYYNQGFPYQSDRYGEEAEHRQWDSGGMYADDGYGNYTNKTRTGKKLPSPGAKKLPSPGVTRAEAALQAQQRGVSYGNKTEDGSLGTRRGRLKPQQPQQPSTQQQQSQSIDSSGWASADRSSVWQSAEDYPEYYEQYAMPLEQAVVPPTPTPHKKRTLPQIRPPSRSKNTAVSLPQTPIRQLPTHMPPKRTSAPVSRTTSAEYDFTGEPPLNENYNYAYVSTDNLPSEKVPYDNRTSVGNYGFLEQQSYQATRTEPQNTRMGYPVADTYPQTDSSYPQTDRYPQTEATYEPTEIYQIEPQYEPHNAYKPADSYQPLTEINEYQTGNTAYSHSDVYQPVDSYPSGQTYIAADSYPSGQTYAAADSYPPSNYYEGQQYHEDYQQQEDYHNAKNSMQDYRNESEDYYYGNETYYDAELQVMPQKKYLTRRALSPMTQQNTDSLESRDDELRDESFETAVDSICSSIPQKAPEPTPLPPKPPQTEQKEKPKPSDTPGVGLLSGLLGQSKPAAQQTQNQNQQQQGTNLLSNPALAAMNVTKGFFSSITSAVNNTVQSINKQPKPQPQPAPAENQVQRIQVTKRGSLKQQDSVGSLHRSFDDFIPEEEEDYAAVQEKEGGDYYEQWEAPRRGSLQHQEVVDSYLPPRGALRVQESVDSCADEIAAMTSDRVSPDAMAQHDNSLIEPYHPDPSSYPRDLDDYIKEESYPPSPEDRPSVIEPYHPSTIEPYPHPQVHKTMSPSPPVIQKQQSIDIEGHMSPSQVVSPTAVASSSLEEKKSVSFEDETMDPLIQAPQPERRKMTAKEKWHRAYNLIVQQLNVLASSIKEKGLKEDVVQIHRNNKD